MRSLAEVGVVDLGALAPSGRADRFELEFIERGRRRRAVLSTCHAVRFEAVEPVRGFGWARGNAHFPGWWWSATTGLHVGYESWLERDHVMLLDFDPRIVALACQPFWLHWRGESRPRRHAPDFFARRDDGIGVVIDIRPDDRIEPADAEAFEVTGRACAEVGWEFRRLGALNPVTAANVRWLSRYRHPRCEGSADLRRRLREVFAGPAPLLAGAQRAGDAIAVLPVLFHLMWRRELVADLMAGPLHAGSLICRDPRSGR